jgi:hypothetical protein
MMLHKTCWRICAGKQGETMRTTVTLDEDVKALLAAAAFRSGRSFKATLNDAVRAALARDLVQAAQRRPPAWPVHDLGRALVDLDKAIALAAELDDQAAIGKMRRGA